MTTTDRIAIAALARELTDADWCGFSALVDVAESDDDTYVFSGGRVLDVRTMRALMGHLDDVWMGLSAPQRVTLQQAPRKLSFCPVRQLDYALEMEHASLVAVSGHLYCSSSFGRAVFRRQQDKNDRAVLDNDRVAIEALSRELKDDTWSDVFAAASVAGTRVEVLCGPVISHDECRVLLVNLDEIWASLDDHERAYLRVSHRIGSMSYFHRSLEDGGLSTGSPSSGWTLTPRARAVLKRHQDKLAKGDV